ncbi:MAG TPA: zinc-ribbon domain-containing protein [Actinobacteria bacterium]|nr:zinc-ribbon domain-containing protein [Actinomycetes bacterium]HEX21789.1 zinc-ribbon domain-containing protein [Actinomycetota bacterium]
MKCSECGAENPKGNLFCEDCGAKLSKTPKSIISIKFAAISVLILLALGAGLYFFIYVLPIRQGKSAIEKFTGKQNLKLAYYGRKPYIAGKMLRFSYKKNNKTVDYYVDSKSKEVVRMDNWSSQAYQVKISKDKAKTIAEKYVDKHFSQFNQKDLKLTEKKLVDSGGNTEKYYTFTWMKVDGGSGALMPVGVNITINPLTGAVISFLSFNKKTTVSTDPKIGKDEAIDIAKTKARKRKISAPNLKSATLAVSTVPPDDPNGKQALLWQIVLEDKSSKDGVAVGAFVYVDDETGKVVKLDPFM